MSEDFQNNGERLLKDTRQDVALAHRRIERANRTITVLVVALVVYGLLLAAAFSACWSRPSCGCRTHGDERRMLFVDVKR